MNLLMQIVLNRLNFKDLLARVDVFSAYGKNKLNNLENFLVGEEEKLEESNFVKGTIGVGNVCETTALLAAKSRTLIQHKTIYPKTTVAIAQVTSK